MFKLQFALWRRDVALRHAAKLQGATLMSWRDRQRVDVLKARAERWANVADFLRDQI